MRQPHILGQLRMHISRHTFCCCPWLEMRQQSAPQYTAHRQRIIQIRISRWWVLEMNKRIYVRSVCRRLIVRNIINESIVQLVTFFFVRLVQSLVMLEYFYVSETFSFVRLCVGDTLSQLTGSRFREFGNVRLAHGKLNRSIPSAIMGWSLMICAI